LHGGSLEVRAVTLKVFRAVQFSARAWAEN
jgi:hypothetical protein